VSAVEPRVEASSNVFQVEASARALKSADATIGAKTEVTAQDGESVECPHPGEPTEPIAAMPRPQTPLLAADTVIWWKRRQTMEACATRPARRRYQVSVKGSCPSGDGPRCSAR